jgi:hypothetical protein
MWCATGKPTIIPDMKSVFYRLYTEDSPDYRRTVIEILKKHGFEDFTLFNGNGYWEGAAEPSLVIEVVVPQSGRDGAIESVAKEIGSRNGQNAIGLVRFPVEGSFLLKGQDYASYAKGAVIYQAGDPWVMPEPPNRPYRGKILFACGDWHELLPKGVEKVRGRLQVRYTATQY